MIEDGAAQPPGSSDSKPVKEKFLGSNCMLQLNVDGVGRTGANVQFRLMVEKRVRRLQLHALTDSLRKLLAEQEPPETQQTLSPRASPPAPLTRAGAILR